MHGIAGCSTPRAASAPATTDTTRSTPSQTYNFEGVENRLGWTAGVGVEWALWDDWSVRLEYDYYGFGTRNVTFIEQHAQRVLRARKHQAEHSAHHAWREFPRLCRAMRKAMTAMTGSDGPFRQANGADRIYDDRGLTTKSLLCAANGVMLALVLASPVRAQDAKAVPCRRRTLQAKLAYCEVCHGVAAQGFNGYYPIPRLAGQQTDYMENQLQASSSTSGQTTSCSMSATC